MRHTSRFIICISVLFALATVLSLQSAATDQPAEKSPEAVKLPASVDLRPEFKKFGFEPRHQGPRGTCSVFTVTAALEFAISKQLDKPTLLSVEYLNWAANQVIHFNSDGHYFHNLMRGYKRYGICREESMPYRTDFDPAIQPSSDARAEAKKLRAVPVKITWINPWGPKPGLTDEQMTKIKERLAQGWPVGTGSGHSRLFVGYRDDAAQPGGGIFLTKDSGAGAYAEVTYDWTKTNVTDVFWIEPSPPQADAKK